MSKKLYVARCPRIAARKLGEETLVMAAQGSTLFTLNPTATILRLPMESQRSGTSSNATFAQSSK